MTKKRWIGVLLTAVMVFAMGVPCFAMDYAEIEPYIQPQECKVRVVDVEGNPVTNLCVENYKNDNTNPAKDYSKERWFAYTDLNGIATLCTFPETASDFFYVDNFHSFGNGDKHDFRTCEKVDGVYQVVWTEETPLKPQKKQMVVFGLGWLTRRENRFPGWKSMQPDILSSKSGRRWAGIDMKWMS